MLESHYLTFIELKTNIRPLILLFC